MYKQGDILQKGNLKRKVLGICGEAIFVSIVNNFEAISAELFTEQELQGFGYTLVESEWEPSYGEKYYYIQGSGDIGISSWFDCKTDNARKNFLGVFKSQEAAQARLQEIKEKLNIK